MTLFPGVTLPVDLGRPASVEAIRHANSLPAKHPENGMILVATQRDPMVDEPRFDDLYPVVVMGELTQVLHGLPGRLTVFVRGIERVYVHDLEDARGFVAAHYHRLEEPVGDPVYAQALTGALQDLVKQHDEHLPGEQQGKQGPAGASI